MAEKVKLDIDLSASLGQVVDATKGLKLDKGQAERLDKHTKGAQLALETGDLKEFQKHFNSLIKIFKDAAAATGEVSKALKEMTDKQSALNQEINRLKDKKTALEGKLTKDGSRITAKTAKEFAETSSDAKKVITSTGKIATRDEIIELHDALSDFLEKTGKKLSEITKDDLAQIKTKDGLSFDSRNAAFAANRYVKAESAYESKIKTDLEDTTQQISVEEQSFVQLDSEIKRMSESADQGAASLSKLYAEILKIAGLVNTKVTDDINTEKLNKTDRTGATSAKSDLQTPTKQPNNGLGKAFKQFTLYNLAIKAAKKALQEAIQTVKELDKYLTEQAMVTGRTRKETYALVKTYQELALQCGATTKEVAQVATEYMKQGKTLEDSLVLTEAAIKAAKVARVSVGDSVNYLTTALNGFRLEASEAMAVSDKFAAVAAASATDYDELAIALSKVASQANLAGMSIDYTTALLTKGLETTREAPETMGTALKTIIARMREMGDYGETLEGDTDINNVESQLAYVGIALRDANGELRSTEDVLDELGQKWDTLNKNQQAAVAKALAGTRQQSRLIAMMEDYERVTELQEISKRSAGATAAQAEVYMEGMEGAMNRIQVAWEKVVMTFTESEVIIGIFNGIAKFLDYVATLLENPLFTGTVLTLALGAVMKTVGLKLQEQHIAKETAKIELERNIQEAKAAEETTKQNILTLKGLKLKIEEKRQTAKTLRDEKIKTAELKKQKILNDKRLSDATKDKKLAEIDKEIQGYNDEYDAAMALYQKEEENLDQQIKSAQEKLKYQQEVTQSFEAQQNGLLATQSAWKGYLNTVVDTAKQVAQYGKNLINIINKIKKSSEKASKPNMKASASGIPMIGWIIALVIEGASLLATIISTVTSVWNFFSKFFKNSGTSADNTAESVNKIATEIYKLQERAAKLKQSVSAFQALDDKVIKSKEDMEALNEELDKAGESLDTEKVKNNKGEEVGESQKEKYDKLKTTEERKLFIENALKETEEKERQEREKALQEIETLRTKNHDEFVKMLTDTSNSDYLATQSLVRSMANSNLYDAIDALKELGEYSEESLQNTEALVENLISSMSALDALSFARDAEVLKQLIGELQSLQSESGEYITDIFLGDDASFKKRLQAFEELKKALGDNAIALNALKAAYSDWEEISGWDQEIIDFIDATNMSFDQINNLYASYKALQKQGIKVTKDEYQEAMDEALKELDPNLSNLEEVLQEHFYSILASGKDFAEGWETLLNQIGNVFAVSTLDMGQNMEKFENRINSFYEKSLEWANMSESERMEFLTDNAELFKGTAGEQLLEAFEHGNYEEIDAMLFQQMEEERQKRLIEVERTLAIEERRGEEERNNAYIQMLKKYRDQLKDTENLYKASLEIRLEQEKEHLDEYKSYLEEERTALEDSLNKRKEAYEKYFDAISRDEEDEDYDEKSSLLISNLSKLGSSMNASATEKRKELEQQLEDLEKERLETLRERAQEQIIQNIDDQLSEISDKFDKLLESNQALLAALQGELDNPTDFLSNLITNKVEGGATALELEEYIRSLENTYGGVLDDNIDWDAIQVREENNQLFLTVNGHDIALDTANEANLYEAIMKALREIGVR